MVSSLTLVKDLKEGVPVLNIICQRRGLRFVSEQTLNHLQSFFTARQIESS